MRKRILTEDDLRNISASVDLKADKSELDKKADKSDLDNLDLAGRTSTIVIANYDSHENSKKGADIVINKGENASIKINDVIQSLKGTGGEVKLMEGNYVGKNLIRLNIDNVSLIGLGHSTVLNESIQITGEYCTVKDMVIVGSNNLYGRIIQIDETSHATVENIITKTGLSTSRYQFDIRDSHNCYINNVKIDKNSEIRVDSSNIKIKNVISEGDIEINRSHSNTILNSAFKKIQVLDDADDNNIMGNIYKTLDDRNTTTKIVGNIIRD